MHRLPVLSLLISILACGGDDNGTEPGVTNVSGSWSLSISNMTGGGATCSTSTPVQLVLQQNTTTLVGSFSGGGVLTCTAPSGSSSSPIPSGSVVNGQINGNEVSFDLGSTSFHQTGTVTGSSMGGTATWTFPTGGASTFGSLSGSWTATRQ